MLIRLNLLLRILSHKFFVEEQSGIYPNQLQSRVAGTGGTKQEYQ